MSIACVCRNSTTGGVQLDRLRKKSESGVPSRVLCAIFLWALWASRAGSAIREPCLASYESAAQVAGFGEQIQHVVQMDFLPDLQLVFGFCQVVEQKLLHQRAAQSAVLALEMVKPHGQIGAKVSLILSQLDQKLFGIAQSVQSRFMRRCGSCEDAEKRWNNLECIRRRQECGLPGIALIRLLNFLKPCAICLDELQTVKSGCKLGAAANGQTQQHVIQQDAMNQTANRNKLHAIRVHADLRQKRAAKLPAVLKILLILSVECRRFGDIRALVRSQQSQIGIQTIRSPHAKRAHLRKPKCQAFLSESAFCRRKSQRLVQSAHVFVTLSLHLLDHPADGRIGGRHG